MIFSVQFSYSIIHTHIDRNLFKKKFMTCGADYYMLAFSTLTLLVGRQEGHPACKKLWWGAGVVICLERGADLHMAQMMPLPL